MVEFTTNYRLSKPDFNISPWHDDVNGNMDILDAVLFAFSGLGNIKGIWTNNTVYTMGDRVVDDTDGSLWQAQVSHTSAVAPTTFAADRTANPTYWDPISQSFGAAVTWTTATSYAVNQFVVDAGRYGVTVASYISGASYNADVAAGNIITLIDLSGFQPSDTDLTAIAALATTGLAARTGAGTWATRTITGTANKVDVTNGNGVAGNPTLTLPDAITLVTPTITGTATFQSPIVVNVTAAGAALTMTSTDAGASVGPSIVLDRNSASPANGDDVGSINFVGRDSGGGSETYGRILCDATDVTAASEDGSLLFAVAAAGVFSTRMTINTAGITVSGTVTTTDVSASGNITATGNVSADYMVSTTLQAGGGANFDEIWHSDAANTWYMTSDAPATRSTSTTGTVQMGNLVTSAAATIGTTLTVSGQTNINGALVLEDAGSNLIFHAGDTNTYMDEPVLGEVRFVSGGAEIWRSTASGINVGNTTADPDQVGASLQIDGQCLACAASTQPWIVNRTGTDGTIINIRHDGVTEGTIASSGTTISYNAFLGSHWSQLIDNSKPDIPIGTICDSIAEMCHWPQDKGQKNDRLPRFKITNADESKAVYGVFIGWDNDEDETNDAYIAAIGAGWIRIRAGEKLQIGDLICSAGNGCGKVQSDDIMRSITVGKVSSTEVVEVYSDGSFRVPCTLHCG